MTTATAGFFFQFYFVVVAVAMNGYGTHSSATSLSQSQEQCEQLTCYHAIQYVTTKKRSRSHVGDDKKTQLQSRR